MRIDAHQHFWKFEPNQYPWIQAHWPIRRDFLPAELGGILAQVDFEGSIAVQARQTLEETRWLLQLADAHPHIQGVVGWIDLRADNVPEQLAEFVGHPKFVGVRHVLQDEPDDRFMLQPEFMRGLAQLRPFNLTYDLLVFPRQLPAALELVRRFPEQRFVLDHIAKPPVREGTLSPWREWIQELAQAPNVFCKVSGLITEAAWGSWEVRQFTPYLDVIFGAFGLDRLMYGSDWPVCLLSGTYVQALQLVLEYLRPFPPAALDQLLGGNAARFYLNG